MRQCDYCGREYEDEVAQCLFDGKTLSQPKPPRIKTESEQKDISWSVPPPIPEFVEVKAPDNSKVRRLRIFEIVVVCSVAFGSSILNSGFYLFKNYGGGSSSGGTMKWVLSLWHEAAALGLLGYVLLSRGRSLVNLGLSWQWKDIPRSILLWLCGLGAFEVVGYTIYSTGLTSGTHAEAMVRVQRILFRGGISFMTFAFQFVNPFFEELIVRAYLMTEIKRLTNNTVKAIFISVVLQASYHLYQGVPAACADGATFLVFAIYFAKTGRIMPVILAHLYIDVLATAWAKSYGF